MKLGSFTRCASCPTKSDDVLISYFGLIVLDPRIYKIADLNSSLLYTSDAADERTSVDLGGRPIPKKKNKRKQEDE